MAYRTVCRAYSAYISGILIIVVGFAGASESFPFPDTLVLGDLAMVRHGWAEKNSVLP